MARKQFRELLKEQGKLTDEQIQEAVAEQEKSGGLIGQILLRKGHIKKEDIAKALATQLNIPFVEKIKEQMIDTTMLSKIPLKFLRQHVVIPIMYEGGKIIVTANPRDLQPIDDISLLMGGDINVAVGTDTLIIEAINKYYPLETSKEMMEKLEEEEEFALEEIEEKDIMEMANDAPIIKMVNHILFQAVKENASDIHIEPFEKELRVRYRIDGVMYEKLLPPKRYQGAVVSRIKIMANLNIAEKRIPQDGRIQIKVADKAIDIRTSILPCNFGERVVMRLLDKTKGIIKLEEISMSERDREVINRNIERPNGIVLVSGPTGSGKTTTLYSILDKLNEPDVNIITVEDPVEYTIHGIGQVQVKEHIGLTFAAALRSILRQDPDVILIGEIRDEETARIATQSALTGHIVLSTIHTNSAPATITRLLDMKIEPFLIASSVVCVISQRLVRRLCDKCKQQYTPTPEMIKRIGLIQAKSKGIKFYKSVGCEDCLNSGYKGRMVVFEVMEIDDEISKLIVQKVDASVIKNQAVKQGMTSLAVDGLRLINAGSTTIEEVVSVAYAEEPLEE